MTTSRLMGRIRGKDEVSEPRKPKERGSQSNGPTWLVGLWKEKGMAEVETK